MVIDIKKIELCNFNWDGYEIKRNNLILCRFNVQQMLACCGSSEIANFISYHKLEEVEKKQLFKLLQKLMANTYGTRHLMYRDSDIGHINDALSPYFEKIGQFRNPNSDNMVEIRSYTMSVNDWNSMRNDGISEEYDSEEYDPDDY